MPPTAAAASRRPARRKPGRPSRPSVAPPCTPPSWPSSIPPPASPVASRARCPPTCSPSSRPSGPEKRLSRTSAIIGAVDAIAWIAEQRIREAMEAGAFDGLAFRGRRIPLDDDPHVAPELRMAFKILKDAGCLPAEMELRKEVASLSELLSTIAEPAERRRILRERNDRLLRLGLLRGR